MKNLTKLIALMLLAGAAAFAQDQTQPGVARVSLIHGDVSVQRGDSGDWVAAALNTPVVNDDRVSTGDRSRTELQLDFANILRLDQHSTARVASLSRNRIQVQVGQGVANYDVLKGSEADAEIDTPNVAVHPLQEGRYRIRVVSDTETEVIVRKGEAEITTPQGSTRIEHGQMITIEGTNNPQYQTSSAPRKDDWDDWNGDRDHLIARAESWRYTDRYYTGASDLDAYGHWTEVPDYGSVWVPVASPGWAPYRVGRWVWEPYYGWTWVSYEPWGWAPYHYGRWFLYGGSWCWWPGPVVGGAYYPVWSPAYVSFFGFGGGISFGFGFGHIGWLPIGPADYYHPWYGYGSRVVNVTNITNINNINNVNNINNITNVNNTNNVRNGGGGGTTGGGGFVTGSAAVQPLWRRATGHPYSNLRLAANNDPRVIGAVSTVPAEHFGTGAARVQPADINTFRNAGVITGRVPVVPTRESLQPAGRAANPSTFRPASAAPQRFFTRGQAAPAPVRPFNQEVAQMQKIIGDSARAQQVAHANPATASAPGSTMPGAPQNANRPAAQLSPEVSGRPAAATKPVGQPGSQATERPGWNRFGSGVAENRPASAAAAQSSAAPQQDAAHNPQARTAPGNSADTVRPGWHSFGSRAGDANGNAAAQSGTAAQASAQSQPANPGAAKSPARNTNSGSERGSWQHFGTSSQSPDSGASAAPRASSTDTRPGNGQGETNSGNNRSSRSGGWQHFTPGQGQPSQPHATATSRSGQARDSGAGPASRGAGWRTFTPRSESSGASRGTGASERPPLDLRQPIVTPRSSRGYDAATPSAYSGGGDLSRSSGGYGRSTAASSSGGYGRSTAAPSSGGYGRPGATPSSGGYGRPAAAPSSGGPRGGGAPASGHPSGGHASSGGPAGSSSGSHPR